MKKKLELRKWKKTDAEKLSQLMTNNVCKTIAMQDSSRITKESEEKWIKKNQKEYKKKNPLRYVLAITLDKDLIGSIGYHEIDHKNESATIGYWIGERYWGKGIATKALKLFLKESNKKLKLKRIEGYTFTFNPASKKVMEKCGFKLEGIKRKRRKIKNKFYDYYQLAKIQ